MHWSAALWKQQVCESVEALSRMIAGRKYVIIFADFEVQIQLDGSASPRISIALSRNDSCPRTFLWRAIIPLNMACWTLNFHIVFGAFGLPCFILSCIWQYLCFAFILGTLLSHLYFASARIRISGILWIEGTWWHWTATVYSGMLFLLQTKAKAFPFFKHFCIDKWKNQLTAYCWHCWPTNFGVWKASRRGDQY